MNWITNTLLALGLTRDSWLWFWSRLVSGAGIIAAAGPFGMLDPYFGPDTQKWIIFACVIVLWLAGKYDTSPLPAAKVAPRNFHGRADFMVVALALGGSLVLTGCASSRAFIAPAPDATDQAAIRSEVNRAVIGLNHGVLVLRDVGDALPTFGLPARDLNRIDCGIARVLGTSAPAPAPVVAVCGPIPLTADAPFGRALDELENVTSCAGLQSTLLAVGGHVGPVLDLLDQSTSTPLRILGASLRLTLAVTAPGGVQCH